MLVGPINSGAAVGGAGVATSTGQSVTPIYGLVYAVQVKYNDAPPAGTTDITIKTKGTNAPSLTILAKTNGATDALYFPRADSCKASDASALSLFTELIPVEDYVQVIIDQADAADNIDVWLYLV